MCFGICLLALIVGVMSERAIEDAQRREQEARERLALERQRETLQMHLRRIDEINRLSHDMRNHLTSLLAMSGSEEARAYIERLLPSLAPVTVLPVCGVKALDVLLSQKMDKCAQAGGALIPCVDEAAREPLSRLGAPELSVIFGNLLDNAVEAVRAVPEPGERGVVLRVAPRGAFLLIRTENRYAGERSAAPGEGFATTKKDADAHGFGLRSVEASARRLGGEMSAEARDGQFFVNILLPLPEGAPGKYPGNLPDRPKK